MASRLCSREGFIQHLNTRAGFTLTEVGFVIVIITIFILLLTPIINNIRSRARIIACEENLQAISLGLKLYANEHQGEYPPNLVELAKGGYVADEKVFDCPSSPSEGTAADPEYHYTTGYNAESPSGSVVVFDKANNHKRRKHVLYTSGDINWENK